MPNYSVKMGFGLHVGWAIEVKYLSKKKKKWIFFIKILNIYKNKNNFQKIDLKNNNLNKKILIIIKREQLVLNLK